MWHFQLFFFSFFHSLFCCCQYLWMKKNCHNQCCSLRPSSSSSSSSRDVATKDENNNNNNNHERFQRSINHELLLVKFYFHLFFFSSNYYHRQICRILSEWVSERDCVTITNVHIDNWKHQACVCSWHIIFIINLQLEAKFCSLMWKQCTLLLIFFINKKHETHHEIKAHIA